MKKLTLTVCFVVVMAIGGATAPVTAKAPEKKGRIVLTVGPQAVEHVTVERWMPNDSDGDPAVIRVFHKGKLLAGVQVKKNCTFDYMGRGLVARIHACDDGRNKMSPLRVRVASARDDTTKVVFTYGPR